ncbi:MAG: DUF4843 domain-containing protein [Candidatus Symbiothrix sp.]|jgi:hypothetical protein|nr:DUF4843 domain-containing protein [Candidatus Symbiothrix sp.]
MKTTKSLCLWAILTAAGFCACEYEPLPTYKADNNIYFSYADEVYSDRVIDSTFVRFGYDKVPKTDTLIGISVKVQGAIVDYDRPVSFTWIDSLTTSQIGYDVELLPDISYVPAGSDKGTIYVRFFNTEVLTDTFLTVGLQLVENKYFKVDYTQTRHSSINKTGKINSTHYRLYVDNSNEAPNYWVLKQKECDDIFGAYSRKKFALLCELFKFDRDYFSYDTSWSSSTISSVWGERFPSMLTIGWSRAFNFYLDEYKINNNGNYITEEDGSEMTGGAVH